MLRHNTECPRGRIDCDPLANIESDCRTSFVCCGENDGSTREMPQDVYRLCFKNDETDEMTDNDEFDLLDLSTVITAAMVHKRRRDDDD